MANLARESINTVNYFGAVLKSYNLPSAAAQRWSILKQHLDLTLKLWSEMRWESRLNSMKPLRNHIDKDKEALLEAKKNANDSVVRTEAHSKETGSFRFQTCTVVWYNILLMSSTANRLLQTANMQLDVALSPIDKAEISLVSDRALLICCPQQENSVKI